MGNPDLKIVADQSGKDASYNLKGESCQEYARKLAGSPFGEEQIEAIQFALEQGRPPEDFNKKDIGVIRDELLKLLGREPNNDVLKSVLQDDDLAVASYAQELLKAPGNNK